MHLYYEKELDYAGWNNRLIKLSRRFVLLVFGAELLIYLLYEVDNNVGDRLDYLFRYVILPTAASAILVLIMSLICRYLLRRGLVSIQAYFYIAGIVVFAYMLCWAHHNVPTMQTVFLLPSVIALTYVDRRLLFYSALTSLSGYALFTLCIRWYALYVPVEVPGLTSIVATVSLMLVNFWICRMVLKHQTQLVTQILHSRKLARQDSLTGLMNHASFYEVLDTRLQQLKKNKHSLGLILMDIDNFKSVNDSVGHAVGDDVILALAECLREHTKGDEVAFRYGGEEFAILTWHNEADCMALSEQIRVAFEQKTKKFTPKAQVTVSAGVCIYSTHRFGAKREFFAAADSALYFAKRNGKNRSVLWDESMLP